MHIGSRTEKDRAEQRGANKGGSTKCKIEEFVFHGAGASPHRKTTRRWAIASRDFCNKQTTPPWLALKDFVAKIQRPKRGCAEKFATKGGLNGRWTLIFDPVHEAPDRAKPCTEAAGSRTQDARLGTEGVHACTEAVDGGGQDVQAGTGLSERRTARGQTMTDRVPPCTWSVGPRARSCAALACRLGY